MSVFSRALSPVYSQQQHLKVPGVLFLPGIACISFCFCSEEDQSQGFEPDSSTLSNLKLFCFLRVVIRACDVGTRAGVLWQPCILSFLLPVRSNQGLHKLSCLHPLSSLNSSLTPPLFFSVVFILFGDRVSCSPLNLLLSRINFELTVLLPLYLWSTKIIGLQA